MIAPQELRKEAREKRLPVDLIEKDYVLGWILFGIASSPIAEHIAFKGGTALSKMYFPGQWRLSEDLDFTLIDDAVLADAVKGLDEVPSIVEKACGITLAFKNRPFTNPNYVQSRFQFTGPISRNTVKIEFSKEGFIGEVVQKAVPQAFDYPSFDVRVYSLENMFAEKMRTLLERGKVRDYYDVWKMLKLEKFDAGRVKDLFLQKCKAKEIVFIGLEQMFPSGLADTLRPFMKVGLTRLTAEPLPSLEKILEELKESLGGILAQP